MSNPVPTGIDWDFVLKVIQFLFSVVVGVYVWVMTKDRVTNDRIEQLKNNTDKRMDAVEQNQVKMNERVAHLPSREAIGNIHKRLDQVQQDQAETKGELKGMHKTVDLIHKHMMEKDK